MADRSSSGTRIPSVILGYSIAAAIIILVMGIGSLFSQSTTMNEFEINTYDANFADWAYHRNSDVEWEGTIVVDGIEKYYNGTGPVLIEVRHLENVSGTFQVLENSSGEICVEVFDGGDTIEWLGSRMNTWGAYFEKSCSSSENPVAVVQYEDEKSSLTVEGISTLCCLSPIFILLIVRQFRASPVEASIING